MLVDNEWPEGFTKPDGYEGTPRYEDVVKYCKQKGQVVSKSAVGRFATQMRVLSRMRTAGVVVRDVMKDLTGEKALQTQKAVAEIITAQLIEAGSKENLSSKDLTNLAKAVKDCTAVAFRADQYYRDQVEARVQTAADSTKEKLTAAGVDRKLIQSIIDEHLGVTK